MHVVRLSLSGTVVLTLLVGATVVATAQDDSDAPGTGESTQLDFTTGHGRTTVPATIGIAEGRTTFRGHRYDVFIEANDPRLTGNWWSVFNYDRFNDTALYVGSAVVGIDNEDGSWRGTSRYYATPQEELIYEMLDLTGEGAYEGLTARLLWLPDGSRVQAEGIIFDGELPPFPEPPAAGSEATE